MGFAVVISSPVPVTNITTFALLSYIRNIYIKKTDKSHIIISFRWVIFWEGDGRNGSCFGQFVRKTLPSPELHQAAQTKEFYRKTIMLSYEQSAL